MAILSNGKFYGFLCSAKYTGRKLANGVKEYVEDFVSGFAGRGWKLWKTVAGFFRLEIDELVVRRTMTVFELLIQKIRAVKGAIAITQANGKIKTSILTEDGTAYLITLEEDDMSFVEHDYFRCQEFSGGQRFYHVEIESVSEGIIRVPASEFTSSLPDPGDEIVQFGNSSHDAKYAGRHSAIYMHADESGQPAIDVMFDIYSKEWTNCVKVRVGGDIPDSGGLKGFYCENGMIKCVDENKHTTYCLHPDGTAELGDGAAIFRPDKSGHIADGAIKWEWNETKGKYVCTMGDVLLSWDNLDDETKENLKGEPGNDGISIQSVDVQYAQNDSNFIPPASGWQTTAPDWVKGRYIWSRTRVVYTNSDQSFSDPACISGESGLGIESIEEQYYQSTSPTELINGSWSILSPTWKDKWYIWTRSVITYTDGSKENTQAICVSGGKGDDGSPGDNGNYTKYIFRNSINKPSIPVGNNPTGWRTSPDAEEIGINHGDTFNYVDGFYVSTNKEHSSISKNRLMFTTHSPNQVIAIELVVSAEESDYAIVGALDKSDISSSLNVQDKISGVRSKIIYMDIPSSGAHFFYVAYAKDSSVSTNDDNCKYRVLTIKQCWTSMGLFSGVTDYLINEWSGPALFIGDSPDVENIYILQETNVCSEAAPYSDPHIDDYIPQITHDVYSDTKAYVVGDKVKSGTKFYQAIQNGIDNPVTMDDYWKEIPGWTDNPSGASDRYPYEFVSTRKKKDSIWLSFSAPVINSQMGIPGKPGEDANLLPWVEQWNNNQTEIDGEYVVSPKMFSGTKSADGKLTGIAQGKDCITIDGVKRTGIFALVDNEVVFELDPINKKYMFRGRIEADEGSFTGKVNALSGTFKNGVFRDAVIETGRFGELNIDGPGLTNKGFDGDAYVILRNDKTDTFAGIGGNMMPAITGGALAIARFSTARRSGDSSNTGIIVSASGSSISNTAIDIDAGYVAGLNVKTEWLDSGTINRKTTFVQVNATNNDPTITLPSNPEVGKIIYICSNNKAINVSGGNRNIYFDGSQRNTIHIGGAGRMSMFIFNGTHWACGLMAYT